MKNIKIKNNKNGGLSLKRSEATGKGESSVFNRGFSLVEMLVAVAIFMSIMTVAVSSLISIINANNKAQSIKSTIDSVTFAIENISRDMRVGSDYQCLPPDTEGKSDCLGGGPSVQYVNSEGYLIKYVFSTDSSLGVLTRTDLNCYPFTDPCPAIDLISRDSNVNISNMTFFVIGADHGSDTMPTRTQPRVIITASGLISSKGSTPTSFNLQTTASQRIRN